MRNPITWIAPEVTGNIHCKYSKNFSQADTIIKCSSSYFCNPLAQRLQPGYGSGFTKLLKNAVEDAEKNQKATVFGYWVSDPERYGVAEFDNQGNCLSIEEKPREPKSNYAVVGLYFYPNKVVDVAKKIKPSARGELEITSVNQEFLTEGELKVQVLGRGFAWLDTGTHDSLAEASTFIEVIEKRQGLKVACLEGIAYRNGWISEEHMREIAKPMLKNQYGQYLMRVIQEKKEEIDSDTFRNE